MSATRKTEKYNKLFSVRENSPQADKGAVLDNLMGTEPEHKTEQVGEQMTEHVSKQSNEHITSQVTEQVPVTESNTENEPEHDTEDESEQVSKSETSSDTSWDEKYKKGTKKEDTHTRATWLIRNDLLKQLDKLARSRGKGFKTDFVNHAIEEYLKTYKK